MSLKDRLISRERFAESVNKLGREGLLQLMQEVGMDAFFVSPDACLNHAHTPTIARLALTIEQFDGVGFGDHLATIDDLRRQLYLAQQAQTTPAPANPIIPNENIDVQALRNQNAELREAVVRLNEQIEGFNLNTELLEADKRIAELEYQITQLTAPAQATTPAVNPALLADVPDSLEEKTASVLPQPDLETPVLIDLTERIHSELGASALERINEAEIPTPQQAFANLLGVPMPAPSPTPAVAPSPEQPKTPKGVPLDFVVYFINGRGGRSTRNGLIELIKSVIELEDGPVVRGKELLDFANTLEDDVISDRSKLTKAFEEQFKND